MVRQHGKQTLPHVFATTCEAMRYASALLSSSPFSVHGTGFARVSAERASARKRSRDRKPSIRSHRSTLLVCHSTPELLVERLRAQGYVAYVARSAADLERLATRNQCELIVGDLRVGHSDPVRVCTRLKASLLLCHIPIVVLSSPEDLAGRIADVEAGADEVLSEPLDDAELAARIDGAIARTRSFLDANPLTGLPGNSSIKGEIAARLASGRPFAVLLVDIDSFKAFNDRYGFQRGDEALQLLGRIVVETVRPTARRHPPDFAGNIGGDDFVLITTPDRAKGYGARVCRLVDERMPALYDAADRQSGAIASVDREGQMRTFPLMTVSVAIVTDPGGRFSHPGQIAQVSAEIKHYLKQLPGSNYMDNRRSWAFARPPSPPIPKQ